MAIESLSSFIDILEKHGELIRVTTEVSCQLEITEIADRVSKQFDGGKAILFGNNQTHFPILINALGSRKRICLALGVNKLDEIGEEIDTYFELLTKPDKTFVDKLKLLPHLKQVASWLPKKTTKKAKCQEVVHSKPDLSILPILKCWPHDGGKFITYPIVHTKNPENLIRNVGMYRMQVIDEKTTGLHWHRHKGGAYHYELYKKSGKRMPVAVALGGDPIYTYAATAPLPEDVDEYLFAGFLRKKSVTLVKCLTQDIEVPSDADIVIEGYVDPSEELFWEGPFGDHTGYYSLADWYPKFHITCITHKKNAIYPTTIVGIPPMEDAYIGEATERIFLPLIRKSMLPEIVDMHLPPAGVAHNIVIVSIKKRFPGQGQKVIHSLLGAGQMMFTKILIVVDENVKTSNYAEVLTSICKHAIPKNDFSVHKGPMDVLDHSSEKFVFGGKLGIDATKKIEGEINSIPEKKTIEFIVEKHISAHQKIKSISADLYVQGFPVLLISIKKNEIDAVKKIHTALSLAIKETSIQYIIYMDELVDISNIFSTIWQLAGNFDPARDIYECENIYVFDGTMKTKEFDNFKREWPNIVVSNDETIELVDKKWHDYKLGEFIPSPSNYYKHQQIGNDNAMV